MAPIQIFHSFGNRFNYFIFFRGFLPCNPSSNHRFLAPSRKLHVSVFQTHALLKSVASKDSGESNSFTISYLVNSCGLTSEIAMAVSQKVQLHNTERSDAVLALLRSSGFSKTQVSKLVKKRPMLLLAGAENTLLPKIEFFYSIGVSRIDLARILTADPTLLTRSLENQIIPCYKYLKSLLLLDEKVVAALKRTSWIFLDDHSKSLIPNISLLREIGVPESCLALLLTHFPEALVQKNDKFGEIVDKIKEMGFNPKKSTFVLAIHALSGKCNKTTWKKCYEVYRKWGWSKDEIFLAFKKHPHCMILSEKKISKGMDFFVNTMGCSSGSIANSPVVLFFSLEKRIIPRCSVIQVLSLKGLIKKNLSLTTVLLPVEKRFVENFVNKYLEDVPHLWDVYKGNISLIEA